MYVQDEGGVPCSWLCLEAPSNMPMFLPAVLGCDTPGPAVWLGLSLTRHLSVARHVGFHAWWSILSSLESLFRQGGLCVVLFGGRGGGAARARIFWKRGMGLFAAGLPGSTFGHMP